MTDAVLVSWTSQPVVLAVLLAWGFGEAVALPIVPDVLLGLLALATPAALVLGLLARTAGVSVSSAVPIYVVGWTVFYLAFWWVRRG